jgi:hypothetical protein
VTGVARAIQRGSMLFGKYESYPFLANAARNSGGCAVAHLNDLTGVALED